MSRVGVGFLGLVRSARGLSGVVDLCPADVAAPEAKALAPPSFGAAQRSRLACCDQARMMGTRADECVRELVKASTEMEKQGREDALAKECKK